MNPTEQQLASRLSPTATNIYVPQEGIFRASGDVYGTQPIIYKRTPTGLQTFDLTSLLTQEERQAAGNAGQQWELARNRAMQQYGFDFGSLTQANIADLYQQMARSGLGYNTPEGSYVAPQTMSTNINDFLTQQMAQLQQQTINQPQPAGTPGTTVSTQRPTNTGTPVQQPSTPYGSPQAQPNGGVTPIGTSQVSGATTPNVPTPTYTIQQGDTLSRIAATYGTTVGALMALNPQITDANKIYTGQKLNLSQAGTGTPGASSLQSIQQGITGATAQAQQIQEAINKLNSAANTGQPTPPQTQTGKTETQNIIDTWMDVSKQLGLSDIKTQYNKTLDDQRALEDKMNDEIADVNNNPWYSQGKRVLESEKIKNRYETKLNTLSNYAKLYDALYQEGRATAEFLTTGIQRDQQFAVEIAQKKQEAADQLKLDASKLHAGIVGEYQFAVQQGYKGSFTQYQNEDANRKMAIAAAGVQIPSGVDTTLKTTGENFETINSIQNVLLSPDFSRAFGPKAIIESQIPGTAAYTLNAQIQQIRDKISLSAREKLKGQGQISNFEGQMLANAQTALRIGMNPSDAKQELINIAGILTTASGGSTKVLVTDKRGQSSQVYANGQAIARMRADGLLVNYIQ